MSTVTLQDAQARLPELVASLNTGEEIVITLNDNPVAKLVNQSRVEPHPVFGRGRGMVIIQSEDDGHLKNFQEYMP